MAKVQRDAESIREMASSCSYEYEQIRFLSDNTGPRLSESPQAAAAVTHIARRMRELGPDGRLEPMTSADTFDKVRIDEMRRVIEVIAFLVYALAQHESKPLRQNES